MNIVEVYNCIRSEYVMDMKHIVPLLRSCYSWLPLMPDGDWPLTMCRAYMNFRDSKTLSYKPFVTKACDKKLHTPLLLAHAEIIPGTEEYTLIMCQWLAYCAAMKEYYFCTEDVMHMLQRCLKLAENDGVYNWNWENCHIIRSMSNWRVLPRVNRALTQSDLIGAVPRINEFHKSPVEHSYSYYFKNRDILSYGSIIEKIFEACINVDDPDLNTLFRIFSDDKAYFTLYEPMFDLYLKSGNVNNALLNLIVVYANISGYRAIYSNEEEPFLRFVNLEAYYPKEMREWIERFPTREALCDAVCELIGKDARDTFVLNWLKQLST